MSDTSKSPTKLQRRRSDSRRLESWKAISSYMNRSVRTVRRWEENENLPIHRHRHNTGDTVYAYCAELDEWRNKQPGQTACVDAAHAPRQPAPFRDPTNVRRYVVGGLVGAALAVAAIAIVALFQANDRLAVQLATDIEVLISPPVLGDSMDALDTALATAIQREIETSIGTRAVPPERVRESLRLMRQDDIDFVSPPVARELLLRDGRADLLLIPFIAEGGEFFSLSIEAVAASGKIVDYRNGTARQPTDIPSTFASLARESIGAYHPPAVPAADRTLPAVTAASMPALRLYAHALDALKKDESGAALKLLELAVEQEPEFASAWTLMGWAMRHRGSGYPDLIPVFETATRYVDGISAVERYFVEGSYQHALQNRTMAEANYNALFVIDPAHEPAATAALTLCVEARPDSECLAEYARVADLRPDHLESNINAAWLLAANGSDPAHARRYADRAMALYAQTENAHAADSIGKTLLFPVLLAWTQSDLELTLEEQRKLLEELPGLSAAVREYLVERLGRISLAMGRIDEAEELFGQVTDQARRYELQARVLFARGNAEQLKKHLVAGSGYADPFTVMLLTMAGLAAEAKAAFAALPGDDVTGTEVAIIQAAFAMHEKDPAVPMSQLEKIIGKLRPSDEEFFFLGLDMYARLLLERGQVSAAISTLEITAAKQQTAAFNDAGLFWLMCQQRLAQFYQAAGREADAAMIDRQLMQMLQVADAEYVANRDATRNSG